MIYQKVEVFLNFVSEYPELPTKMLCYTNENAMLFCIYIYASKSVIYVESGHNAIWHEQSG